MEIFMMNLILDLGRSMKWMMTLNLYLIPLKKILEIYYTYESLTQPMGKDILWRVTIIFISQRMDERGGLFKSKENQKEKYPAK